MKNSPCNKYYVQGEGEKNGEHTETQEDQSVTFFLPKKPFKISGTHGRLAKKVIRFQTFTSDILQKFLVSLQRTGEESCQH